MKLDFIYIFKKKIEDFATSFQNTTVYIFKRKKNALRKDVMIFRRPWIKKQNDPGGGGACLSAQYKRANTWQEWV